MLRYSKRKKEEIKIRDIESSHVFLAVFASQSLELMKQDLSWDWKAFDISLIGRMLKFK